MDTLGKGDWKRKSDVPPDVVRANWDRIFTEREKKITDKKRTDNGNAKQRHTV